MAWLLILICSESLAAKFLQKIYKTNIIKKNRRKILSVFKKGIST